MLGSFSLRWRRASQQHPAETAVRPTPLGTIPFSTLLRSRPGRGLQTLMGIWDCLQNPSLRVPIYKVGHNSTQFKGFSC